MTAPSIVAHQLTRTFGQRVAVDHLDLEAPQGTCLGLLGPNGAGKSTTVRMLTGLLAPTSGRATVAGVDVVRERHRLGQRIGVVFEQQNLYDRLSAAHNLRFFADLVGVARARADALLEQCGLAGRKEPVSQLSKGLRQRILIARALLCEPAVLFLDEPTSGLDPASARDLRGWVSSLTRQGTTVLLTTHDLEDASELCAQVAIMHRGCLLVCDSPSALIAAHAPPRMRVRWRPRAAQADDAPEERLLAWEPASLAQGLEELRARGEVLAMEPVSPSLEDVFVTLTGSTLRTEAPG